MGDVFVDTPFRDSSRSGGVYSVTDLDSPNQYKPGQISTNITSIEDPDRRQMHLGSKLQKVRESMEKSHRAERPSCRVKWPSRRAERSSWKSQGRMALKVTGMAFQSPRPIFTAI